MISESRGKGGIVARAEVYMPGAESRSASPAGLFVAGAAVLLPVLAAIAALAGIGYVLYQVYLGLAGLLNAGISLGDALVGYPLMLAYKLATSVAAHWLAVGVYAGMAVGAYILANAAPAIVDALRDRSPRTAPVYVIHRDVQALTVQEEPATPIVAKYEYVNVEERSV